MKSLDVDDLVPLNAFSKTSPIEIDPVYAKSSHPDNHFRELYHPEASVIWAQKDLAVVTLLAAQLGQRLYGWDRLKINDCLRPVEAQERMAAYGYHPLLVSKPGSGAHPRAMAIDIEPREKNGELVRMGTPFDHFVADPERDDNPAARNFTKFAGSASDASTLWLNRQKLEFTMRTAATMTGQTIWPLPQEWWDFRFPETLHSKYKPLKEADLHPYQRLIQPDVDAVHAIAAGDYPRAVAQAISEVRQRVDDALPPTGPSPILKRTETVRLKHLAG